MRTIRSLGFRTDLFLVGLWGEVIERDRYVVVRTPDNPDFRWGNFLLYREAPDARAAAENGDGSWRADHARELPHARATLFAWDSPDGARGAADAFVEQGFEIDEGSILTATRGQIVEPDKRNSDVRVAR